LAAVLPAKVIAAPIKFSTNGHYYETVSRSQGITWSAANTEAMGRTFTGMHGHLATITVYRENDFLAQHFPSAINNGYWLGGFQTHGILDPSAGWQWVTGEPWSYTNWNRDEPNDYEGTGTTSQDENRLHFWFQAGGALNDLRPFDTSPLGYIVEYEPDPSPDAPTVTGYAATQPAGTPIVSGPPGAPLLITGANLGKEGTVLFDGL